MSWRQIIHQGEEKRYFAPYWTERTQTLRGFSTYGLITQSLMSCAIWASSVNYTNMNLIAGLTARECVPSVEVELCEPVRELMTIALAHDIGPAVMLQFAELIRAGHDVGFAVEEIGSALRS